MASMAPSKWTCNSALGSAAMNCSIDWAGEKDAIDTNPQRSYATGQCEWFVAQAKLRCRGMASCLAFALAASQLLDLFLLRAARLGPFGFGGLLLARRPLESLTFGAIFNFLGIHKFVLFLIVRRQSSRRSARSARPARPGTPDPIRWRRSPGTYPAGCRRR